MKYSPTTPKTKSPNPTRVRYMRKLVSAGSFILIVKTLKRHQFDHRYSIKAPKR
ncbi:hypothetical protein [Helicobacter pylori]|uniref:hypothetical protein n=1 Tax=Helicobacter pylori TaxID=210 RepID=UPI001AFA2413|nr:hypothetical protein [Helicobacter pylori]QQW88698.1 hypothetical protein HG565_00650 [Helicobacter pylori]